MKFVFLLIGLLTGPAASAAGAYAPVNGIRMYYEIHGPEGGVPLVLLHGGGSTINSTFGRILPELAKSRRVIAIEEQGHGRTSDRPAPVRFETSAEDVSALLKQLKVKQADLFGFSNGASVALQVAIRHPEQVHKLIFASSFTKRAGAPAQLWEFINKGTFETMPQPLKDEFLKVNPDPAKLRAMHDKDAERIRGFKDVPDQDVRAVKAETLILSGDRDVATMDHLLELTKLFTKNRIVILPGGHGDYLGEVVAPRKPELIRATAAIVDDFLGGVP